jgi:hypothetical protein
VYRHNGSSVSAASRPHMVDAGRRLAAGRPANTRAVEACDRWLDNVPTNGLPDSARGSTRSALVALVAGSVAGAVDIGSAVNRTALVFEGRRRHQRGTCHATPRRCQRRMRIIGAASTTLHQASSPIISGTVTMARAGITILRTTGVPVVTTRAGRGPSAQRIRLHDDYGCLGRIRHGPVAGSAQI